MPRRYAKPEVDKRLLPGGSRVYRTYTIVRDLARDNVYYIVKDRTNIGTAKSEEGAREMIDGLFPQRNPARKAKVSARGRRATSRRSRNPLPKGRALRESFTLSTLRAVRQGGRVEKVWYEDARDGQHYYHDFDGEQGAIMYLCESAAVGKCVLIVPGDLSTPLWEDA